MTYYEDTMDITRIDSYDDGRFSKTVLNQHGAYLVDNEPYQVEIINSISAVIRGNNPAVYNTLIEEFRFHAPHIVKFYDESAKLITEYPIPKLLFSWVHSYCGYLIYLPIDHMRLLYCHLGIL